MKGRGAKWQDRLGLIKLTLNPMRLIKMEAFKKKQNRGEERNGTTASTPGDEAKQTGE